MKLAITAERGSLDSPVDPRFGRARYFLLVDTETDAYTVHDNLQNLNAPQGAGIQAAQAIARLGAEALLTGHVGPKAYTTLQAAGIPVYSGAEGTVREALAGYRAGRFQAAAKADVEGHWA